MNINLLTGNGQRMPAPDLTAEQYDALMVLLDGKSYSEHLTFNGREYFRDGGLWVVAWRGPETESGDPLERPSAQRAVRTEDASEETIAAVERAEHPQAAPEAPNREFAIRHTGSGETAWLDCDGVYLALLGWKGGRWVYMGGPVKGMEKCGLTSVAAVQEAIAGYIATLPPPPVEEEEAA